LSVVSYAPVYSVRLIGLAVAATVTIERTQLVGRVNMAHHKNCDTHTLSMGVRDCIRYIKCAKTSYIRTVVAKV